MNTKHVLFLLVFYAFSAHCVKKTHIISPSQNKESLQKDSASKQVLSKKPSKSNQVFKPVTVEKTESAFLNLMEPGRYPDETDPLVGNTQSALSQEEDQDESINSHSSSKENSAEEKNELLNHASFEKAANNPLCKKNPTAPHKNIFDDEYVLERKYWSVAKKLIPKQDHKRIRAWFIGMIWRHKTGLNYEKHASNKLLSWKIFKKVSRIYRTGGVLNPVIAAIKSLKPSENSNAKLLIDLIEGKYDNVDHFESIDGEYLLEEDYWEIAKRILPEKNHRLIKKWIAGMIWQQKTGLSYAEHAPKELLSWVSFQEMSRLYVKDDAIDTLVEEIKNLNPLANSNGKIFIDLIDKENASEDLAHIDPEYRLEKRYWKIAKTFLPPKKNHQTIKKWIIGMIWQKKTGLSYEKHAPQDLLSLSAFNENSKACIKERSLDEFITSIKNLNPLENSNAKLLIDLIEKKRNDLKLKAKKKAIRDSVVELEPYYWKKIKASLPGELTKTALKKVRTWINRIVATERIMPLAWKRPIQSLPNENVQPPVNKVRTQTNRYLNQGIVKKIVDALNEDHKAQSLSQNADFLFAFACRRQELFESKRKNTPVNHTEDSTYFIESFYWEKIKHLFNNHSRAQRWITTAVWKEKNPDHPWSSKPPECGEPATLRSSNNYYCKINNISDDLINILQNTLQEAESSQDPKQHTAISNAEVFLNFIRRKKKEYPDQKKADIFQDKTKNLGVQSDLMEIEAEDQNNQGRIATLNLSSEQEDLSLLPNQKALNSK